MLTYFITTLPPGLPTQIKEQSHNIQHTSPHLHRPRLELDVFHLENNYYRRKRVNPIDKLSIKTFISTS